ncbi:hypothetical protein NW762_011899 [Fusarium torreyae]|uniref:Uncharacterized protein n=1 Tax=Fusarium torreyae TaxID=1237075 RepID=A0A9W8RSY9_9HYPO|nr:hypothetical protein NW762_011899 [Fusarium torreyae]
MASELEGLIAGLLVHISCQGEEGCPVGDVLDAIHHPSKQHTEPLPKGDSVVQHRTASNIWSWLAARRDISVGPDREYNHLTLDEVLALSREQDAGLSESNPDNPTEPHHVRVYASEDTMWESLTGHAVDYKRVPKSEWMLLLGIASTTTQGILQGDLGRLTDQDKRSVPKRTDALLKKGYIVKRTTLVRGTKTSKMWLKLFAPPLPKDGEGTDEVLRPDMTLTRQVLVENLEPVPWHVRWTGESIDYIALATTILAIVKEWGVLQMKDMKSKLGVLGMRWQMKVLAKVCRFLNQRGVIQYVAAKLGEKVFKDCVKYVRDLNSEDWSLYLSTGKRKSKAPRNPDLDGLDGNKQLIGQASNVSEISKAPPWSLDKPVAVIIAEMAHRLGDVGLTNPDVYALTLGPSYSRHLSSMTTALSIPNLQPPHLSHFQIYSEHTRSGKVASYRYFAPNGLPSPPSPTDAADQSSTIADAYGFSSIPSTGITSEPATSLTDLCNMGTVNRKIKGRPKKPKVKKQKSAPTPKATKTGRKPRGETSQRPPPSEAVEEGGAPEEGDESSRAQEAVQEPDIPCQNALTQDEVLQPETQAQGQDDAASEPQTADKLVVTLKVSADALKELLALFQTEVATPARPTRGRSTRSSAKKTETGITSTPADDEDIQVRAQGDVDDELEADRSNKDPLSGRKRGRPKKGEPRKRGNAAQTDENDPASKPWVCEKCGGRWKNDIGLRYHKEKSRTACNPSFDESTMTPIRRGKKRAASEIEDQDVATPVVDKPKGKGQGAAEEEDRDTNQENEKEKDKEKEKEPSPEHEDAPTPKRVSKLRGPVAARPTWSSRPTVSFKGDAFQVNPELQRPPVAMFGTPKRPSLLNETNGALVQGENSQPRPVLGPLDRFNLFASSPKTSRSRSQRNGSQSVTTPQSEQPESAQHVDNGTPNGHGSTAKNKTPTAADTPLSRALVNSRVSQIVQSILTEQSGAFPGGKPLWTAITIRWAEMFPEAIPQSRSYQAAFREMVKTKIVAEHWLTFRSSKGITEKCHIIVQAERDPFSPEVTEMVQKIQEAHPDPYLPPPFSGQVDNEVMKRGRRDLPEEVEMLDAPVYVARAAQKRAQDEFDDDGDDFQPPPKRGRKRKSAITDGRSSKARPGTWKRGDTGESMWYEHFESSHGAPEALQFLDPNTFLEEDDTEGIERHRLNGDLSDALQQATSTYLPEDIVFDKPILISGDEGVWPYLSIEDFEMQDASYTLKGWMPDSNWFAWSSMIDMIDRKAHSLNRQKLQHQLELDPYQSLTERLYICMDLERAWSESFIHAPPGAAGPFNIFVSFSSEADDESVDVPALSWPSEWQLTPKSFPGDVPDRALLLDSPSDEEEDDSLEWPSFPGVLLGSSNGRARGSSGRQSRGRGSGGRYRTSVSRPRASISRQQQLQQPRVKRVRLVTRALMPISEETAQAQAKSQSASSINEAGERLLAALVAVRVLLGGADKLIDWGLILKIFPNLALKDIRRFWVDARRDQGAYVKKLTKDFQDKFLIAYERQEVPELDFDDPLDYDWDFLIDWTLELPRRKGVDLPLTKHLLEENFTSQKVTYEDEDPREKFYNPQSSVFSRFEAVTVPAIVTVDKMLSGLAERIELTEDVIARSWVRSLCCTDESRYTVDQIKQKFSTLAGGDQDKINLILKEAVDALTKQRIICKSKRPPLSGRPFRLNEAYSNVLGKLAQRTKYQEAADFKAKLDAVFRRGEAYRIPFTLNDGSIMALTNLNASERISLKAVDVPHIPLGFEPLHYESRKLPKALYRFDIEAVPTDLYRYDEDIGVLRKSIYEGPPTASKDSVLPQWVDFFGRKEAERWMDILGAFCFVYATRGFLTIESVCSALKPILEEFEAKMIMDWGLKTGVLKESEDGLGLQVGEWWWLAVPWQWGRQLKQRGRRDDD